MNEEANEHAAKRQEHLISLNKLEMVLGCLVALISLVGCIGSWYVLPYRVSQVELEQKNVAVRLETSQRQTEAKMEEMKRNADMTRELLIRIDERLRQVQVALKLQSGP